MVPTEQVKFRIKEKRGRIKEKKEKKREIGRKRDKKNDIK